MMQIIESLYEYFKTCPLLDSNRKLNVSFLPAEKREYSIDAIPAGDILKRYVDGSTLRQYLFTFGTSEYFDADTLQNIANLEFFELLAAWLEAQTKAKLFPEMESNQIPIKIEAQTTGYMHNAFDGNNARYQIQCSLQYRQRRT